MAKLIIHQDKCVGCSLCVRTCPSKALYMKEKKADVNENCTLCGMCVDACKFEAIELQRQRSGHDASEHSGIWVYAEYHKDSRVDVSLELIAKARELSIVNNTKVCALLFGYGCTQQASALIDAGADMVYLCDDERFINASEEPHYNMVSALIYKEKPQIVLFGATSIGRSLAPRIAARMQTGLTADCTILEIDGETGLLQQTRPAFGGNLMATIICPDARPQMATVRPGVMKLPQTAAGRKGQIIPVAFMQDECRVEVLKEECKNAGGNIADAQIIISVGKGIGSRKNLKLIERLANKLGASLGVSRPLVDMGWSEYQNQIGQTGCNVSPKLLLSIGISGAMQHVAGIGNAETIIAVNNDPQAPIFSVADYGVIADGVAFVKELLTLLEA